MTFEIGQTFIGLYPPGAAKWCNENNCLVKEIDPENGKRRFVIQAAPAPTQDEIGAMEIAALKAKLAETDYVVMKIAEGVATKEEYADVLAQRAEWRRKINELEAQLA